MRQRRGVPELLAVFHIVVDRVVVQADGLERREIRRIDGARGQGEDLAELQLFKASKRNEAVFLGIELGRHRPAQWKVSPPLVRAASSESIVPVRQMR